MEGIKQLGEILLDSKLIDSGQLKEALKKQSSAGGSNGNVFIGMESISEEKFVRVLSKRLRLPIFDSEKTGISDEIYKLLPTSLLSKHHVVPIKRIRNKIQIAMANPLNYTAIRDIEFITGSEVEVLVASYSDIKYLLESKFIDDFDTQSLLGHINPTNQIEILETEDEEDRDEIQHLKEIGQTAPIVNLVNKILSESVRTGTSDIHIEPRAGEVIVRNRIDGILRTKATFPIHIHPPMISRLKIMAKMDIAVHRRPQDGSTKIKLNGSKIDFRISTLPTLYGEKMVIRVLDKNQKLITLDDLGIPVLIKNIFCNLLTRPQGMVLATGPTGSGKSTTLYACLNYIRSEELNMITIEDPVEYSMPGVNQVQVNEKAGITFVSGLRSILRQDPNVIMVGEIRDKDTAAISFQASLTGHLVFSTLHTNNAVSAVTRLLDIGIEPYLLASSIVAIVAQRLVRRNCPHCLKQYTLDSNLLERLKISSIDHSKIKFYRGVGCRKCDYSGYLGRIGIFEILNINNKIKNLIVSEAGEKDIFIAARRSGMNTMEENGLYLVLNRTTTVEEVLRVIPPEEISPKTDNEWVKRIHTLFNVRDTK